MTRTILIVDDEHDLAAICERLLIRRGWTVAIAASREAVVMVTGYGAAPTRRLALDEGAAGFLAKPFSMHDLLELVRRTVGDGPGAVRPTIVPSPGERPRSGIHC